jgi:hypothetical protein
MYQWAYLAGDLLLFLIWLAIYLFRKDLRKEVLTMSLVSAPLGPLSEFFYLRDYWHPELLFGVRIGIEDILFSFCIGGIAGVIYEELFRKRYSKRHLPGHRNVMMALMGFGILWTMVGAIVLHFNSIYVSTSGFLLIAVIILIFRQDLILDAFLSGIAVGFLMFCFYLVFNILFPGIIEQWWLLQNISGILIVGVPLEELMWGFGWGMIAGPAYEFIYGYRFLKR